MSRISLVSHCSLLIEIRFRFMYFLTKHAEPAWGAEEVHILVSKIKAEIESGWHLYQKATRVWAQKPFDKEEKAASS